MSKLKTIVLGLMLVLTAYFANHMTPQRSLAKERPIDLETMIPLKIGDWSSSNDSLSTEVLNPELATSIKNVYSQTISRLYSNENGEKIMLSVAYTTSQSDNGGRQTHLPEVCYPAQGFKISDKELVTLRTEYGDISATQLLASTVGRTEPITYWITVGNISGNTNTKRKINQIKYGLQGIIADGLIIRVSHIAPKDDWNYELNEKFIADFLSSVGSDTRLSFGASH